MTETAVQPEFLTRRRALREGQTDGVLARRRRTGELTTLRPGTYLSRTSEDQVRHEFRHHLLVIATRPYLGAGSVISHVSAAVLHGLPLWSVDLTTVHATRTGASGGHRRPRLHTHMSPLTDADVVEVDGVQVTSVSRTVTDLARTLPFEQAVVVADGALHRRLTSREELAGQLTSARRRRGTAGAHRVVAFADGRSESPGESRSRVVLDAAGVRPDALQAEIRDRRGTFLGRVDFLFNDGRTVGEFDGMLKYGRGLTDPGEPGQAVFAEKIREDALRAAGFSVVRWVWRDLQRPKLLADRIRRAR